MDKYKRHIQYRNKVSKEFYCTFIYSMHCYMNIASEKDTFLYS